MKRIVLLGLVVLVMLFAGPASAQVDDGSALPLPGEAEALPSGSSGLGSSPSGSSGSGPFVAVAGEDALADTGFGATGVALLAGALLVAGAAALTLAGRGRAG